MKNFIKKGQKLPLYGIGPYLVIAMGAVTLAGIILSMTLLESWTVKMPLSAVFIAVGALLCALGIAIWLTGAVFSGTDKDISENRLKTDGIFALVRNPMYSGWWMMFTGISLFARDPWLLAVPFINWGIMTLVLINTEEKWLKGLYGKEYDDYKNRVNRCIPWFPKKDS